MSTGWTFNRRTLLFTGDREALDALWEADQPDTERERRALIAQRGGAGRGWLTDEQRDRIIELHKKGRAVAQIVEIVGTSRGTVRRTLEAAGFSPARPPLQPCGTPAAYKRHRVAGEPACEACRQANTEASIAYRGRRAGQVAA